MMIVLNLHLSQEPYMKMKNLNSLIFKVIFWHVFSIYTFGGSIYEGVNSLNPGHYLIVKDGKLILKYFDINESLEKKDKQIKRI